MQNGGSARIAGGLEEFEGLTSFSSDEPSVECAKSTKDEFNRDSVEGLLVLIILNQVGLFLPLQYSIPCVVT